MKARKHIKCMIAIEQFFEAETVHHRVITSKDSRLIVDALIQLLSLTGYSQGENSGFRNFLRRSFSLVILNNSSKAQMKNEA